MYRVIVYTIIFFLSFFSISKILAQTNVEHLTAGEKEKLIKIQQLIRAYSWLKKFSGATLVAKDGIPFYKYTTGYANLDYMALCALKTPFNLCATTESVTALAVMKLVEQRKLKVQDPISRHIPKIAAKIGSNITIHQLLTHTSGVPDYYSQKEYINIDDFLTIDNQNDLLDIITKHPLDFEPGSQYNHSASGYVLLASIIEQVSGLPYTSYVQKYILDPLELEDTKFHFWKEQISYKAKGYLLNPDTGKPEASADFWGAFPFGADALFTTTDNMLILEQAVRNAKIIAPKQRDEMFDSKISSTFMNLNYNLGYGWKNKMVGDSIPVIFQNGVLKGLSTYVSSLGAYTVITFANLHHNTAREMSEKIERIFYDDNYIVPAHPLAFLFSEIIEQHGLDTVVNNFDKILQENEYELDRVFILNSLGQEYLRASDYETALPILKINRKRFPEEPITYDSLGECYFKLGDYDNARLCFQKRLVLLPNDKRSIGMLDMIKEKIEQKALERREILAGKSIAKKEKKPVKKKEASKKKSKNELAKTKKKNKKEKSNTLKTAGVQNKKNVDNPDAIENTNLMETYVIVATQEKEAKEEQKNSKNTPKSTKKQDFNKKKIIPKSDKISDETLAVFTNVEKMPKFRGGDQALYSFLATNMEYPQEAYDSNLQGTVYVSFIVDTIGKLNTIRIKKGLSKGTVSCDNEALRLVRKMPAWRPGFLKGRAVNVLYTLPIAFNIAPKDGSKKGTYPTIQKNKNSNPVPDSSVSTNSEPAASDLTLSLEPNKKQNKKGKKADTTKKTNGIFTVVEQMPIFPGGQKAIYTYLSENMQYPQDAYDSGLEGTVYVSFIIDTLGEINNIRIKKGLTKGTISCDNEAIRLIRNMPTWKPGYQDDQKVNVLYTLPVEFRIEEPEEN